MRPTAQTNDRENHGLVGPVRRVETEVADLSLCEGQWVEGPRRPSVTMEFSRDGDILEKAYYTDDGLPDYTVVYSYDDERRLVRGAHISSAGELESEAAYSYDSSGRPTRTVIRESDGTVSYEARYDYDGPDSRESVDELRYSPDGSLESRTVRLIGSSGTQEESLDYDADGGLILRSVLHYDSDGRQTQIESYTPQGRYLGKLLHSYDHEDNLILDTNIDEEGCVLGRISHSYDSHGSEASFMTIRPDGSVKLRRECDYEYDSYGNWIRQVMSESVPGDTERMEPREVVYSRIFYYEESEP